MKNIIIAGFLLALAGCTATAIDVTKSDGTTLAGTWNSTGDTSRSYSDCRQGEKTCLIYLEVTESEDIAPIIDSLLNGIRQ